MNRIEAMSRVVGRSKEGSQHESGYDIMRAGMSEEGEVLSQLQKGCTLTLDACTLPRASRDGPTSTVG